MSGDHAFLVLIGKDFRAHRGVADIIPSRYATWGEGLNETWLKFLALWRNKLECLTDLDIAKKWCRQLSSFQLVPDLLLVRECDLQLEQHNA